MSTPSQSSACLLYTSVEDEVRTLGHMLLVVFALYAPIKVENMILGGGILKSGGNTRMVMIRCV